MRRSFIISQEIKFFMIQIARFMAGQPKKLHCITFGTQAELTNSDNTITLEDSTGHFHFFKVTSVLVHQGRRIDGGHCIAVTKTGFISDRTVTPNTTALTTLLSTGTLGGKYNTGYIYFLQRID